MGRRRTGLWNHPDFLKVWAAQTVSEFGSRFAREGLPLAAILVLKAGPEQVGLLAACSTAPRVLIGLLVGGLVDRSRRRRVMILSDWGRAVVLATVPAAAWLHLLTMPQLLGVAALVGAGSVIFDTANQAYFPTLVPHDRLVEGNTKLSVTASLANVAGPAVAGVLIQLLTAPIAVGVTSLGYLLSGTALSQVKAQEPTVRAQGRKGDLKGDFNGARRQIARNDVMGPILLMETSAGLFVSMFGALYPFIALKALHLTPALFGATFAVGGVGALVGAWLRPWAAERFGFGRSAILASLLAGAASFAIPLTYAAPLAAFLILAMAQCLGDGLSTLSGITVNTLRQTLFPRSSLGRVGAVFQVFSGAAAMIGGVAGGWAGQTLGPRTAMLIASTGLTASIAFSALSPLRNMENQPDPVPDQVSEAQTAKLG